MACKIWDTKPVKHGGDDLLFDALYEIVVHLVDPCRIRRVGQKMMIDIDRDACICIDKYRRDSTRIERLGADWVNLRYIYPVSVSGTWVALGYRRMELDFGDPNSIEQLEKFINDSMM